MMTASTGVHVTVPPLRNGNGKVGEIRENVGAGLGLLPPELGGTS